MGYDTRGFTLVELMIVVIIIAILVVVGFVGYRGVQDRAKVTAIVSGITEVEDAMRLALSAERATEWWDDNAYRDANDDPALYLLIEETNLNKFLSEVPRVGKSIEEDNSFWMYDNDGPSDESFGNDAGYDPLVCPQPYRSGGVNIQIELHNNRHLAQQIDDILDDGNLECGKFREHHGNEGEFLWLLSSDWRDV